MSQNHSRAAPAIDPTKKSSLFEVPLIKRRMIILPRLDRCHLISAARASGELK
jgi:hypothetical protein